MRFLFLILFVLFSFLVLLPRPTQAIVDPLSVPNNKFGIHIISATPDELIPAQALVNSSGGDWGYVTVLIESKDRDHDKWQAVFDKLRKLHLIPLVRLATQPDGQLWKKPYEGEEIAWADFLNNLNWPTKNRYVIVYNEANQAHEWQGQVDARDYAKVLDKTITALKEKSLDFFVLNAGFDASAPNQIPQFENELDYLKKMDQEVPGIFNKLDGWASHSYPNPGFAGPANGNGRGSVQTYLWELQILKDLGVTKNLPVFITETGWQHAEGLNYNGNLPNAKKMADYFATAFNNGWLNNQIVAITPFLLSYQEPPFDHFSFKKVTGAPQTEKILGVSSEESNLPFYPQYYTIQNLAKVPATPIQETKTSLVAGQVYASLVVGESYIISLTFKNTGQSIWNEKGQVKLVALQGRQQLGIEPVAIPLDQKIEPGKDYTFNLKLKAPLAGKYQVKINLFEGDKSFNNPSFEFTSEVKSPVILQINASLKWKENFVGQYLLSIAGIIGSSLSNISLDSKGRSQEIESRFLLPDYSFDFTLEKPFYKPKTIHQTVYSGVNTLDFGELQPDIPSAILHPKVLWQLLPFSN